MKALVLSGGRATRLRPITHTSAKQLVPVANKPILFYALEAIRDAGIRDIGIIVGHTAEEIMAAVGGGERWGVKVTYISQEAPLGLAHAVKIAHPFIGNDRFVMFLGDNLIREGVTEVVQRFEGEQANAHIMLAKVPNPQDFGVAELDGNRVQRLVEKPKEPKSDLALVGVYLFDSNIFKAVNAIKPSARGELEITDAIQYLIEKDYAVHWHLITGWWKDTGKLEDLLEANRLVLENIETRIEGRVDESSCTDGRVIVEKGAEIVRSVIRGPAIIGEDCRIEDSYVGPFTSIYNRVTITGSEVEHSIVLEDSCIRGIGARIEDSLIGKNVTVSKDDGRPRAYRLMLGDNSDVSVL
ncbi:MAG: glucose-1-phosphate thymidylyltransferase [Armatimonadetes bacterium]|nr:glucose-1-phosphate thymidylyltransferase [Armatimonadota bacterium]